MERTQEQIEAEIRAEQLAQGEELESDRFPTLGTLSAAFIYQFTPVAKRPAPPEVFFVPQSWFKREEYLELGLVSWNQLWEAAQYRKDAFKLRDSLVDQLPQFLAWIEQLPESNIYLVAESRKQYEAYAPLYHLLPKRVLDRYGLPSLKRGLWPLNGLDSWREEVLPSDFPQRLSSAFAHHIWRFIDSGSGLRKFKASDPLVLLSHNLDYWLPNVVKVIENRLREFGRVEPDSEEQRKSLAKLKRKMPPDIEADRPLMGGVVWMGEEEAMEATRQVVEVADRNGQLRRLIEAIRSNRVIDDFSALWSNAREDFERKLYRKRAKVRVSFVELDDTIPVHSHRSEYTDELIWEDFSALLDTRERHIVVCLRNGTTKLREIGESLGYANHSPISKALKKIRKKAIEFLGL